MSKQKGFLSNTGFSKKSGAGFTLIEILIVIGIIAILAAAVIIAINPGRQFAQARNTQRRTDVNAIMNAINQNMVDNNGSFDFSDCGATSFPDSATNIASDGTDLCDCLVPDYVAELPVDPSTGSYTSCSDYDTGYQIASSTGSRIEISAPEAELDKTINVKR
jgi:prepilin-type N-terminal cleavage/methylation domain-containing protein